MHLGADRRTLATVLPAYAADSARFKGLLRR